MKRAKLRGVAHFSRLPSKLLREKLVKMGGCKFAAATTHLFQP
ncbi:hypothetical protein PRUB_a1143 [Pseudoalteromonas rubra]|uniref:Uncharacterized protein n=1 Tax=Pseudoalteromonas rubra TaxID=43658 RepID=A0A8T0C7F0_9GAMM|nr:hypothetical protein PRUB_a1143 [Pseudoalteromonas rubra]